MSTPFDKACESAPKVYSNEGDLLTHEDAVFDLKASYLYIHNAAIDAAYEHLASLCSTNLGKVQLLLELNEVKELPK